MEKRICSLKLFEVVFIRSSPTMRGTTMAKAMSKRLKLKLKTKLPSSSVFMKVSVRKIVGIQARM